MNSLLAVRATFMRSVGAGGFWGFSPKSLGKIWTILNAVLSVFFAGWSFVVTAVVKWMTGFRGWFVFRPLRRTQNSLSLASSRGHIEAAKNQMTRGTATMLCVYATRKFKWEEKKARKWKFSTVSSSPMMIHVALLPSTRKVASVKASERR